MAEIAVRANCVQHDDRLASVVCDRCERPVCASCCTDGIHVRGEFCSVECRDAVEAGEAERLLQGLEHPFRTGWALWLRSAAPLARYVLPIVVGIIAAFAIDAAHNPSSPLTDPSGEGTLTLPATITVFAGLLLGVLVVQTVLSKQYTGIIRGNVVTWALQRLIPCVITWALMFIATVLGLFALIVPGIIMSLRLFWADEFALAHRSGPIRSLLESWELTRHHGHAIFVFQFLAGLVAWVVVFGGLVTFAGLQVVLLSMGAVGTYLSLAVLFALIFFVYGLLHAPEVAKFYGMRAARSAGVPPGAASA